MGAVKPDNMKLPVIVNISFSDGYRTWSHCMHSRDPLDEFQLLGLYNVAAAGSEERKSRLDLWCSTPQALHSPHPMPKRWSLFPHNRNAFQMARGEILDPFPSPIALSFPYRLAPGILLLTRLLFLVHYITQGTWALVGWDFTAEELNTAETSLCVPESFICTTLFSPVMEDKIWWCRLFVFTQGAERSKNTLFPICCCVK